MKKNLYWILALVCGITCMSGISQGFIHSDFLGNCLVELLDLKVNPDMTGGVVAKDFIEEFTDSDDLIRYTVYNPVYSARWQINPDYWQIEQTFAGNASDYGNIEILLGESGSPDSYILHVLQKDSVLYDSSRSKICSCETYSLDNGRKISVRIPLNCRELKKFYTARETNHVITLGGSQRASLKVSMEKESRKDNMKDRIGEIRNAYGKIKGVRNVWYKDKKLSDAVKLFDENRIEESMKLLESIRKDDPENALALAYYGSCVAIMGGRCNAFKAMKLVNESFVYLDRASELARGSENEIDVLMNRAEVSASVPNSVFRKAYTGAQDFERCAELFLEKSKDAILSDGDRIYVAYLYASASDCYLKCGRNFESARNLSKAEKFYDM